MKRQKIFLYMFLISLISCDMLFKDVKINININDSKEAELFQVEKEFAEMTQKQGIEKAFLHFAADNAVINREDSLYKGKQGIKAYFNKQTLQDIKLEWEPDYADVSSSGDLGYTYGHYTFSAIDSLGNEIKSEGVFHTVWKKQEDGKWRFVWD